MNKEFKKIILERLSAYLAPLGWRKKSSRFIFKQNDITCYIELQSSQSSTANNLRVTIDLELTSSKIANLWDISLPEDKQQHWVKRIGNYINDGQDKWWNIQSEVAAMIAADEIIEILGPKILPEMLSINSTETLEQLWQKGISPGITDKLRLEFLSLLAG